MNRNGFSSFEILPFITWIAIFAITGHTISEISSHPNITMGIFVIFGILISALLAVGAHYGILISWLAIPGVAVLVSLQNDLRGKVGAVFCLIPICYLCISGVGSWLRTRRKKRAS